MEVNSVTKMNLEDDGDMRVIIYGPAGCGKTTLLAHFPKPMLIFDFDGNLKPIYGIDGIDCITYAAEDFKGCKEQMTKFKKDLKAAKKEKYYKTFGYDSMTSMDTIVLAGLCDLNLKDKADLSVWREHHDWFAFVISSVKAIEGVNHVFLAHEYYRENGDGKVNGVQPLVSGKSILAKLPGLFDEVWHVTIKGGDNEREVALRSTARVRAKSTLLSGTSTIKVPNKNKVPDFNIYNEVMRLAKKERA